MRSRILVGLLAGTAGGFLGWLIQENLINYNAFVGSSMSASEGLKLVWAVGGLIGLFLGIVDGIVEGNSRKFLRGMIVGAVTGVLLGYIGLNLGNAFYAILGGTNSLDEKPAMFSFVRQVVARSFGWAMLGLALGIGSSLATPSPARIRNGALGGLIGGFIGGFIFDILAVGATPVSGALGATGPRDVGGASRAVGFTAIGAMTGFFIGLVEELFKQAWVKVLAGRNEGKDFIFYKPVNILGRDERADVPLYGDPSVGAQHAAIRAQSNRHYLMDGGTPSGVVVNGQRVNPNGELLLRDGDMIQIGTHRIQFREKATASKVAQPAVDVPKSAAKSPSNVPIPSNFCGFCGSPKKADGSCLCSVAGNVAAGPPGTNVLPSYSGGAMPGTVAGGGYSAPVSAAPYGVGAVLPQGGEQMPRLVGMEGPYAGQVFLLTVPHLTVGREPDKDIVLSADPTISRAHARVANEGGDMVVYDNNSANGTFVNNLRISMQVLAPGDIVQFGSSRFRYE